MIKIGFLKVLSIEHQVLGSLLWVSEIENIHSPTIICGEWRAFATSSTHLLTTQEGTNWKHSEQVMERYMLISRPTA